MAPDDDCTEVTGPTVIRSPSAVFLGLVNANQHDGG